MSLISITPLQDGVTSVSAAPTNNALNTIVNDYNGNITDANIASAAAIAGSKVNIASWAMPYKFRVYRTSALNSANSFTAVTFDTKTYDTGTNVDIVTNKGRFTAPIACFFEFSAAVGNTSATNTLIGIAIYKNGTQVSVGTCLDPSQATSSGTKCFVHDTLSLAANDYAEIYFIGGNGSTVEVGSAACWYSGKFVSAT